MSADPACYNGVINRQGGGQTGAEDKLNGVEFERCIDFLAKMIQQYGAEVMAEVEVLEQEKAHTQKNIA